MRAVVCIYLGLTAVLPMRGDVPAPTPSQAVAQQQSGDWSGAENTWRALTRAAPGEYRYWTGLGACLAHQEHFGEAIAAYRKALAINSKASETQLNLGLAYFKSGQFEKAIGPLRAGAAGLPEQHQTDILLGMAMYGSGRYKEAAEYLSRAQQNDPKNSELALVLARSYLLSGNYERARAEFEALLRQDPDSTQVHMLLGEAYDALGQSDDAAQEFQSAAKDGGTPDAHFALGFLLWRDKHYDAAAAEFQQELAVDPKHFQALAYLGDARLKQGDRVGAEKLLKESIAAKDNLWIAHYDLGILAADRKDSPRAIEELKAAAKLDPKRADTHYRLAQIYKAAGQPEAAQQELRTVAQFHQKYNQDLILKMTGLSGKPPAGK